MQTFLPYADFTGCARVLDDKRLWKQVVECKQIFNTIRLKNIRNNMRESGIIGHQYVSGFGIMGPLSKIPWENHPAVLMWEGYEAALLKYQCAMFIEWAERNYSAIADMVGMELPHDLDFNDYVNPPWLGDEQLHKKYKAKLYWKDPEHYHQFFDDYCDVTGQDDYNGQETITIDIEPEYYWPVKKNG